MVQWINKNKSYSGPPNRVTRERVRYPKGTPIPFPADRGPDILFPGDKSWARYRDVVALEEAENELDELRAKVVALEADNQALREANEVLIEEKQEVSKKLIEANLLEANDGESESDKDPTKGRGRKRDK
jgi:hypothetical protein